MKSFGSQLASILSSKAIHSSIREKSAQTQLYPALITADSWIGIDSGGQLYLVDRDSGAVRLLIEWERIKIGHAALARVSSVVGFEHLRPQRKSTDPDCDMCNGTGVYEVQGVICQCGGLGWVPGS